MQTREHQSPELPGPDPAVFDSRGYVIVKNLLGEDEIEQLRSTVIETFAEMRRYDRVAFDPGKEGTIQALDSDLLSIPSLRHVLLDSRVLLAIGGLLGGEPVYFGDSSVRIGANGVRAWHRDNVNRTRRQGPDWQDSYRLIRCGLYLQDHSQHSGGLALRPHSQETKRLLPTLPTFAASEAGNLVAWNMRTVHSGEVVRMRGLPSLALSPRVQSRLPSRMRIPEDRERIVLFMAFGLSGPHLDNYVKYLTTRHYMQRSWSRSRFGPEVWEEAESAGLHIKRPIPTYGAPPDRGDTDPVPSPDEHRSRVPHPRTAQRDTARMASTDPRPPGFGGSESWEQRSIEEHRVTEMLTAITEHPAVSSIAHTGYSLVDFARHRLRTEIVQLLHGWTLARVDPEAQNLISDPATPPALLMGVRAGVGLDPTSVPLAVPAMTPGSQVRRGMARQVMRGIAAVSHPEEVRIAVVAGDGLSLALGSLSSTELRSAGVGILPFPGLDHDGEGALLACRRRLPILTGYGPRKAGRGVVVNLPERLELGCEPELDRALTALAEKLLASVAAEQNQAVRALGGLIHTHSLRTILLPSVAHGAARLLVTYARDRGLRVSALQHDIYGLRELDNGDELVDVLLAWGTSTAEQTAHWPNPRPEVVQVGRPGLTKTGPRPPATAVRRVLIATGEPVDTSIAPAGFCETFVEVLEPGLTRLAAAGIKLELRPHLREDPEHCRQLLSRYGLDIPVVTGNSFQDAAANTDILVSSVSSVACEAGALGLPVLLWVGPAPGWVRAEHLVAPWVESTPGTFERSEDFMALACGLIEHPADGCKTACALGRHLASYAQPFDAASFAETLSRLSA